MGSEKEASSATGRITDGLPWLGMHDLHNGLDEGSQGEVLSCPGFDILGILF
jgi:hypothetical protein